MVSKLLLLVKSVFNFFVKIYRSSFLKYTKRLGLTYLSGNGTIDVSQEFAHVGVELYLIIAYSIIMLLVSLQITFPKMLGEKIEHKFKYIRYANLLIIVALAVFECIHQGKLVEATITTVLLEIMIEIAHPVLLGH